MDLHASYILCSTPRSGSTLLCDLLTSTGVAGRPQSYFMNSFYEDWANDFGVSTSDWRDTKAFDLAYLHAALQEGTNKTGVFGLRLQQQSQLDLSARLGELYPGIDSDHERFEKAFGTTCYIHLSRQDKIAQSVSLLRARQSGLWHVHPDGSERERLSDPAIPKYDFEAINDLVNQLNKQDLAWHHWFKQQGIDAISVSYEALVEDPPLIVGELLTALGLEYATTGTVEAGTAKLADQESLDWIERYRTEVSTQGE